MRTRRIYKEENCNIDPMLLLVFVEVTESVAFIEAQITTEQSQCESWLSEQQHGRDGECKSKTIGLS